MSSGLALASAVDIVQGEIQMLAVLVLFRPNSDRSSLSLTATNPTY